MYEVLLLRANRTVSLPLVMNVLRWIVLLHCLYRVSYLLFVYLILLGYDNRVLEKCLGVLENTEKVFKYFVSKRVGTLT